jgi:hypothetical protein
MYVTRNTEYHFRDGFCIAVRDRRTGEYMPGHLALKRRIHGGIRMLPTGAIEPRAGEPVVGDSIYFEADGRDLVTSALERIDRPDRDTVASYPKRRAAGAAAR